MGLLSGLLTWPVLPVRGVVWIARQVQDEAVRVYYDEDTIRESLAQIDEALRAGTVDQACHDAVADELVGRMVEGRFVQANDPARFGE